MRPSKYFYDKPLPKYLDSKTVSLKFHPLKHIIPIVTINMLLQANWAEGVGQGWYVSAICCFWRCLHVIIEGVGFASISKETPLSKLSFTLVSISLPFLLLPLCFFSVPLLVYVYERKRKRNIIRERSKVEKERSPFPVVKYTVQWIL